MGEDVWYVHHEGKRSGPLSWSELLDLAKQGGVEPADLLWQPEWDDWRLADTVEGLFPVPRSDTEPVGDTPADEVSAEALFDEIPVGGFPVAETPIDEPAADSPVAEPPVDETSVKEAPAVVSTTSGKVAVEAPASRLGRVVVSPSPMRFSLQKPAEVVLGVVRRAFPAALLDRIDRVAKTVAQIAYICAALFVTGLLLVVGIANRDASMIVLALAAPPVALALGYSAARFLDAMGHRLEAFPTTLGSLAFLDGLAGFAVGLAVVTAAAGLSFTLAGAGAIALIFGLGMSVVLVYGAAAALDPSAVGASQKDDATVGEQTVAVLACVAKLVLLRPAPIVYAAATVVAAVAALWMLVSAFGDNAGLGFVGAWFAWRMLGVALLPMMAWLFSELVWLVIDVAGSLVGAGRETPPTPETD